MISGINKNLQCLILFGSHARGDVDKNSDLDLLGIDNTTQHKTISVNKVNLSLYTHDNLIEMAKNGDSFLLHLIKEGKCLFGEDKFDVIKESFKYKDNKKYLNDAKAAYYLASKIHDSQYDVPSSKWWLANKRISWCVRTILISLLMCERNVVFSKSALAECLSNSHNDINFDDAMLLVDAKSHREKNGKILQLLSVFLASKTELSHINKREIYARDIISKTINNIISHDEYHY
ncbi:nucleotidyltransferase domain-containing protein [Aeromonas taiwanensis]|uniref:nucleotidyltransferase domain-containing protein n=1 Tax=Aeromonas taiwanensis TaxID=633417 RepID=UPI003B9FAA92